MNNRQHHQCHQTELLEFLHFQACRQHDKQPGDQNDREVLLEVENIVGANPLEIGQHDTGDGNCDQAGFLAERIGQYEFADHQRQHQEAAQIFWHQMPAQQRCQAHGDHSADGCTDGDSLEKQPQGMQ